MSKPLQYFYYKNGILSSGGISLIDIVKETSTPVYIYSTEGFLTPVRALQTGLDGLDYLICFAAKANSNLSILKLLANAGTGVDVVSGGELYRAQMAGIHSSKTVFSGVGKTNSEMQHALLFGGEGIFSFNVESMEELVLLNQVATGLKRKARVALRFNPDVNPKTHPYISTGLKQNKFGINKAEILKIVHQLKSYPGIDLAGISIHIGSQLTSLSPLEDAFQKLRSLMEEITSIIGKPLRFVDLGGGIGIQYEKEKAPSIEKYCSLVHKYFGKKSKINNPLKILIEPGRVISGNAGLLVTQVLYRKERRDKDFLVIDAAMNDLIRPALYGSYHAVVPVRELRKSAPRCKTDIVGPICESSDCFGKDRLLHKELKQGDLLAILSAGAYGSSMSSNYNSRPRPPEVLIDHEQGRFRVIRKREEYSDLVSLEE